MHNVYVWPGKPTEPDTDDPLSLRTYESDKQKLLAIYAKALGPLPGFTLTGPGGQYMHSYHAEGAFVLNVPIDEAKSKLEHSLRKMNLAFLFRDVPMRNDLYLHKLFIPEILEDLAVPWDKILEWKEANLTQEQLSPTPTYTNAANDPSTPTTTARIVYRGNGVRCEPHLEPTCPLQRPHCCGTSIPREGAGSQQLLARYCRLATRESETPIEPTWLGDSAGRRAL